MNYLIEVKSIIIGVRVKKINTIFIYLFTPMNNSKQLKKIFSSIEKCYLPLSNYEVKTCVKCGNEEFYTTIKNFEKSCKKCKTRYKTTHNTLFHNVRFGLLKAFHIYIDVVYEEPQPKASELARSYNLTYKTAYNFKQKVIVDFGFMKLKSYLRKNKLSNEEKMMRYYKDIKNL
jgi:hypothetical protein